MGDDNVSGVQKEASIKFSWVRRAFDDSFKRFAFNPSREIDIGAGICADNVGDVQKEASIKFGLVRRAFDNGAKYFELNHSREKCYC